jgi:hypothetical protein
MAKHDAYREYAADAAKLASRASTTAGKARMLALADKWLNLADAEEARAKMRTSSRKGRPGPPEPSEWQAEG